MPKIGEFTEYRNPFTPWVAKRWWIDPRILVGGSIIDAADFEQLREASGISHVLSVESERSDWGKVPFERLCYLPTADDGAPQPPKILQDAALFGEKVLAQPRCKLYVHCQMGASRSPTYAYAVLRKAYGVSREEFLKRVRLVMPEWGKHPWHPVYMTSVEDAV